MGKKHELWLHGFPENLPKNIDALYRSRLLGTVNDFLERAGIDDIKITIGTAYQVQSNNTSTPGINLSSQEKSSDDTPIEDRARQYIAKQPFFHPAQLVLPELIRENLLSAIDVIRLESLVFDTWGLREIEPFPRTALNFHGPPGTGKTLAAHTVAHILGRPILVASYAEIESKFHGDGPKNVKAIFHAAERDKAILFIDEADSLLSKRLTNVTQGSEQAINSMRSQLLICLEQFRGVVIFATNLVENYDKAFETRVRHIYFPLPDEISRREIWQKHLPSRLPVVPDVSPENLATQISDVSGRDIKNAVIDAAVRVARHGRTYVEQRDLFEAIERIKAARISENLGKGRPLTVVEREEIEEKVNRTLLFQHENGAKIPNASD